nr:MAG TPA: hypothetical protein [Bacteriophage sp.]
MLKQNLANLRKKDVKHPLSYRYRITNQKPKILLVSMARKEAIKGPRTNTLIFS